MRYPPITYPEGAEEDECEARDEVRLGGGVADVLPERGGPPAGARRGGRGRGRVAPAQARGAARGERLRLGARAAGDRGDGLLLLLHCCAGSPVEVGSLVCARARVRVALVGGGGGMCGGESAPKLGGGRARVASTRRLPRPPWP